MALFLLSFLVFMAAAAGLALGVIMKRRPISAGCGRLSGHHARPNGCEACAGNDRSGLDEDTQESSVGSMTFR